MDRHYLIVSAGGHVTEYTGELRLRSFAQLAYTSDEPGDKAPKWNPGQWPMDEYTAIDVPSRYGSFEVWRRKGFTIDSCTECPEFRRVYLPYGDEDFRCDAGTDISRSEHLEVPPDCNHLGEVTPVYWPGSGSR
jgi:hypothetical protein